MVHETEIQEFVNRIAEEFAPERVILFGSYARGDATPDSDVDLLVIMRTRKRTVQQAVEIRQRVSCRFALDLLVRTPRDVRERLAMRDCFLATIVNEGRTLYESGSQYSVMFRYPGEAATKDEATYAVKIARRIREMLAPLFRRKEAQP